ncbi:MAG: DUF975 family protein [Candidatus Pacebacteria bacterium]|nr:DUF975 family protein [Candidatus Paceibacterota bacterium]MBP9866794.1 DUF975 family protein [Candidatus Paceibacterota bacterium]
MKIENKVLRAQAREALSGKWWSAIGAFIIFEVALIASSYVNPRTSGFIYGDTIGDIVYVIYAIFGETIVDIICTIIQYCIAGLATIGLIFYYIKLSRGQSTDLSHLAVGFTRFFRNVLAYVMVLVATMFGFMLFIIPGVIIALMFSQTLFILADNQEIGAVDAIKKSVKMMDGNKRKLLGMLSYF